MEHVYGRKIEVLTWCTEKESLRKIKHLNKFSREKYNVHVKYTYEESEREQSVVLANENTTDQMNNRTYCNRKYIEKLLQKEKST